MVTNEIADKVNTDSNNVIQSITKRYVYKHNND